MSARISSFCHSGGCVEVELLRTSSLCSGGDCVEVGLFPATDEIAVRDTKTGAGLLFTREEWAAFIAGAKAGEFDLEALP